MKKQILLFFALMTSIVASAQVTIQMEKDGGVYKVPCTVNGVKMKFIFDTGAATVSLSQTMAQFLLDGEYLSESDIKGIGQSQLADGSIVNHAIINLRDIEIGGMHIHNIEATVIEGQNAPLLLGQSAISELGRISIEGNKLIIHSSDKKLSQQQIAKLEDQANRYINAESYSAAIECFIQIDESKGLSENGLEQLCSAFLMDNQYDNCIQYCKRWLKEFEEKGDLYNKEMIYNSLALSYRYGFEDYTSALIWYQKDLDILNSPGFCHYYDEEEGLFDRLVASLNSSIGDCYYQNSNYFQAEKFYKQAIKSQCKSLNVNMEEILQGKMQDERLGYYMYDYAFCFYKQKHNVDGDEVMKLAALCGNQDAIDFCRKYNINYQTKSSKLFE